MSQRRVSVKLRLPHVRAGTGRHRLFRRSGLMVIAAVGLFALAVSPSPVSASKAPTTTNDNPLCSRLGKEIQASSGAQMFCFGSQRTGDGVVHSPDASFGPNSNAASP